MKPQFKRILVSREKIKSEKPEWEQKTFEDELLERTFTLEDCGDNCENDIKGLRGKKVILSDIRGLKVKEAEDVEYFILPQETIMCEASN